MLKRIIILIAWMVLFVTPAMATNNIEVTSDGRTIEISSIDTAWVSSTDTTYLSPDQNDNGLYVYSIYWKPAATDDELTVYSGSSTSGVLLLHFKAADEYDERIMYFPPGLRRHLYIADDDPTAGAVIVINLYPYGYGE